MADITYMRDGDKTYLPSLIIAIEDDDEWRKNVALCSLNRALESGSIAVAEDHGVYHIFVIFDGGNVARVSVTPPYEGDAVTLRFARGWHSV